MLRRPPRSTLFPTRRSSDLEDITIEIQIFDSQVCQTTEIRRRIEPVQSAKALFHLMPTIVKTRSVGESTQCLLIVDQEDRKSTRLNSSHGYISYAVFCLKKK